MASSWCLQQLHGAAGNLALFLILLLLAFETLGLGCISYFLLKLAFPILGLPTIRFPSYEAVCSFAISLDLFRLSISSQIRLLVYIITLASITAILALMLFTLFRLITWLAWSLLAFVGLCRLWLIPCMNACAAAPSALSRLVTKAAVCAYDEARAFKKSAARVMRSFPTFYEHWSRYARRLKVVEVNIVRAVRDVQILKQFVAKFTREFDRALADAKVGDKRTDRLMTDNEKVQSEVKDLHTDLMSQRDALRRLQGDHAKASIDLQVLDGNREQLVIDQKKLRNDFEVLDSKHQSLEDAFKRLEGTRLSWDVGSVEDLKAEHEKFRYEWDSFQSVFAVVKIDILRVKENMEKITGSHWIIDGKPHEQSVAEYRELRTWFEELLKDYNECLGDVRHLRRDHEKLKAQHEELKAQHDDLSDLEEDYRGLAIDNGKQTIRTHKLVLKLERRILHLQQATNTEFVSEDESSEESFSDRDDDDDCDERDNLNEESTEDGDMDQIRPKESEVAKKNEHKKNRKQWDRHGGD